MQYKVDLDNDEEANNNINEGSPPPLILRTDNNSHTDSEYEDDEETTGSADDLIEAAFSEMEDVHWMLQERSKELTRTTPTQTKEVVNFENNESCVMEVEINEKAGKKRATEQTTPRSSGSRTPHETTTEWAHASWEHRRAVITTKNGKKKVQVMRVPPFKPSTGPSTDPAESDQDKDDQKLKPTKSPCADPPNLPKKQDDPNDNPNSAPTLENNIDNSREDLKRKILMSLLNTPILKTKEAGSNDYLLDSGVNMHCSTCTQGMINLQTNSGPVTVGDSREVQSMGKGDLPLETEDGTRVIIHDTLFIHDFHRNIVSLPILLSEKSIVKKTSY